MLTWAVAWIMTKRADVDGEIMIFTVIGDTGIVIGILLLLNSIFGTG